MIDCMRQIVLNKLPEIDIAPNNAKKVISQQTVLKQLPKCDIATNSCQKVIS
uniref:Uncharacterized protein n=1 Tax=Arion vulgaris TaxID=1028688 RepID=A0A0B6YXU6_9EUPU